MVVNEFFQSPPEKSKFPQNPPDHTCSFSSAFSKDNCLDSVHKPTFSGKVVIPAEVGIQYFRDLLDAGSSPA